jgi:hypothetical protein
LLLYRSGIFNMIVDDQPFDSSERPVNSTPLSVTKTGVDVGTNMINFCFLLFDTTSVLFMKMSKICFLSKNVTVSVLISYSLKVKQSIKVFSS